MLFRPGISSVLLLLVQDCCYPLIADSRAAEGLLNQEASQEACASSDEATNLLVHKAALPRMNEDELEGFDGTNGSRPILLALSNVVYDISSEPGLYGPGGTYAVFAGRACSRGVALPSLQLEDVSDDVVDFNEAQRASLAKWEMHFQKKYRAVATLLPDSPEQRTARVGRFVALRKAASASVPEVESAKTKLGGEMGRVFTVDELAKFTGVRKSGGGNEEAIILIALGGHVFDVSASAYLYGPGNPRACYAGRDVTRISALQGSPELASPCDPAALERGGDLHGLEARHLKSLKRRLAFFFEKFPKAGELKGAAPI